MATTTIKIGTTAHVLVASTECELTGMALKLLGKLRANGASARFPNGDSEWVEDVVIVNCTQSGSAQYKWDKDGNKVLCRRLCVRMIKGERHESFVKKVYRKFEDVS